MKPRFKPKYLALLAVAFPSGSFTTLIFWDNICLFCTQLLDVAGKIWWLILIYLIINIFIAKPRLWIFSRINRFN